MLHIFSGDPWDRYQELPEYEPWWSELLRTLGELMLPALGFASPGALLGYAYAGVTGQSGMLGVLVGGILGGILLYLALSFWDSYKELRSKRHEEDRLKLFDPPF